jgi:hypothetical protein
MTALMIAMTMACAGMEQIGSHFRYSASTSYIPLFGPQTQIVRIIGENIRFTAKGR